MTTHSSILAWRILWTEEPGGLQSMGSQKKPDTTEQQLRFQLLENMGYNPRGAQYVLIAYFIWNSPLHRSPLCYPSPPLSPPGTMSFFSPSASLFSCLLLWLPSLACCIL